MITLSVLLQNAEHSRYSSRNQHTFGTAPESNSTIVERGNTQIHDHTLGTAPESNSTIVERGNFDTPSTHT
jgi:hypothetical protein